MTFDSVSRTAHPLPRAAFARHAIAASIAAAFGTVMVPVWAQALPTGQQVVSGTATVTSSGLSMTVTNSPNAVLNWETFRIGPGATVRFEQANAASKVLNRVVSNDPSSIMGTLSSNGSVWLINPNGVLFGQGAQVNVAGLVASTLDVTNADFLAGRARFNSGAQVRPEVLNQGRIETVGGGRVWLVGGSVRNTGQIEILGSERNTGQTATSGNVTLASGTSVELVDSSVPNITLQVAGANFAVENTGSILVGGGTVDLFGGIVNQNGIVRADTLQGGAGTINILGKSNVVLGGVSSADAEEFRRNAGQIRVSSENANVVVNGLISANGDYGGAIELAGQGITVSASGRLEATSSFLGGEVTLTATGALSIQGQVSAAGIAYGGNIEYGGGIGGRVTLTGSAVTVAEGARVDASGSDGGSIEVLANSGALTIDGTVTNAGLASEFSGFYIDGAGNMTLAGTDVSIGARGVVDTSGNNGGNLLVNAGSGTLSLRGKLLARYREGSFGSGQIRMEGRNIHLLEGSEFMTNRSTWLIGPRVPDQESAWNSADEIIMRGNTVDTGNGDFSLDSTSLVLDRARISSGAGGDAIRMWTSSFSNTDSVLTASAGRWVIGLWYGATFNAADFGGLDYRYVHVDAFSDSALPVPSGPGQHAIRVADSLIVDVRLNADREYDGTTYASFTQALSNNYDSAGIRIARKGDWISSSGNFIDKHAATYKHVTIDNGNDMFEVRTTSGARVYGVTQNYIADITPRPVTMNVEIVDKVYDGRTAASMRPNGPYGLLEDDDVSWNLSADFNTKHVGTAKPVTVHFSLNGSDARNYSAQAPTGLTASITPLPITTAGIIALDKVYDGTRAATLSGTLLGRLEGDDLAINTTGAQFDTKHVGTDKTVSFTGSVLSGADAGNYTLSGPYTTTADITPRAADIDITGLVRKVYDGSTNATLGASQYALDGILASDDVAVSGPTQGQYDTRNVGVEKTVTASGPFAISGADAGNYSFGGIRLTQGSNTISTTARGDVGEITQRALSLTGLSAQNKVYDATRTAVVTGTVSNVVEGDRVTFGEISGLFDTKNAGAAKPVTITVGALAGLDSGNYSLPVTVATTSADITPRPITAAGLSASDKVYDGTRAATISGTLAGVLPGDLLTINTTGALFDTKNVGTGKTVSFAGSTLSGADAANYLLGGALTTTAAISPRAAQIAITGLVEKVYDGSTSAVLAAGQYTLGGILGSDAVAVAGPTQGLYDTRNVGQQKTVSASGPFAITGADATNYSFGGLRLTEGSNTISTTATGNVGAITPRVLALSGLSAQNKVYDANRTAAVSGTLSNLVEGDQVSFGTLSGLFDTKNAGTAKLVTISASALGGADAGNYTLPVTVASTTADITPRPITAAGISASDKVYDGTRNASVTGTLAGVLAGDQLAINAASALFDTKNVGTGKTVSFAGGALSGADAANYVLNGTLASTASITPRAADISLTGVVAKVYDGNDTALLGAGQYALAGILAGDSVAVSGPSQGRYDSRNAGRQKTVTVTGPFALSGVDAANYSFGGTGTVSAAIGEITPRALALSGFAAENKTYDATRNAVVRGTLTNVVQGDLVSYNGLSGSFDTKNAGSAKTVTITAGALTGADAGNYTLPTVAATTTADISARPITLAGISAADKVYDGTRSTSVSGTLLGVLASDQVTIGASSGLFDTKDVGANKSVSFTNGLAGADAANYVLSVPLLLTASVTPRPVPLTITGTVLKEYDASAAATLNASQYAMINMVAGDAVTVSGPTQGSYDSSNAGQAKLVSVTGPFAITGADASNYSVGGVRLTGTASSPVTTTANANVGTITPATLVYNADPAALEAALPLSGFTGTVTGFKGSDTLTTATSGQLLWEAEATPGSAPGTYALRGGGLSAANYVFVQAPGNAAALSLRPNQTFIAATSNTAASIGAALASAAPVPNLPDAGGSITDASGMSGSRSFSSVRIGSMNQEELAQMLSQRRDFKRKLFADAIYKLDIDPSLADVRTCSTVAEASTGACRISAAQLQLIHAAKPGAAQVKKADARHQLLPQIERKIAVLFGINDYNDKTIPPLQNAIPDVDAVGKVFADKLGYEVRVLHNPTKVDIIRTLNALATEINDSDSVIVYYAGHGYSLEKNGAGYWLPSDASGDDPRQWISNSDVAQILSGIRSRQMALISDSCYSGAFARDGMGAVGRNVNADDVLAKRSVVVLSSGGDEPVADSGKGNHSIFAWNLMQVVGSVSNWKPGSTIFEDIQAGVKKEFPQTPKYGSVTAAGHQTGGDYLFEFRSK